MPEKIKKGWTRVSFGDVVQLCRERSSDLTGDGFDRYVGLEHLDPGDLKIRRWGNVADGTTFTSVFRNGQVLFGKRRAYQRKVGVADFDGVCSGDIYVLKPKSDGLLQELLPFVCQTDGFFQHAVGTSAGSLSPRTNWESLASYEFALPPLEEQRRIAEVLRAAERSVECYNECRRRIGAVLLSAALDILKIRGMSLAGSFDSYHLPRGWQWAKGRDVFSAMSGNGEPTLDPQGDGLFFKVADFNRNDEEANLILAESLFSRRMNPRVRVFTPGTVIFPKRGASIFLNKVGVLRFSAALDPNLMGLVPKEKEINSDYLYWTVKCIGLWRLADTTSLPQLNHKHLNPLRLPLPPMDVQILIVEQLAAMQSAYRELEVRSTSLRSMKAALIVRELVARLQ